MTAEQSNPQEVDGSDRDQQRPMTPPFLVAGIGASAGGLEAVSKLLQAIPQNAALALVLAQHRARDHESLLPELLRRKTWMSVCDAHDGVAIERGHVYLIPPEARMTFIDGSLCVKPISGEARDTAVNHLFESLATQYGEKAVGIVLSGAGRDGAVGMAKIKAAGGVTLVQEPDEAKVDGMPRAAIASGGADLVLTAENIAAELTRLSEHPFFQAQAPAPSSASGEAEDTNEDNELRRLFQLLRRGTGVDFAQYKLPTVLRRIERRMVLHRLTDLPAYVRLVQENPGEIEQLHDDILINVTSFFREPESFELLRNELFPDIALHRSSDDPIRVWVPGCSSGEEAYSLAITLLEALGQQDVDCIRLFATDVSERMIRRARLAVYPETIAAEVSQERLRRFFDKQEDGYRVKTFVRERCVFARQDVTRDPPFSKLDLVLCRNLLIYLAQPVQRKIISVFHYALKPTGMLMLGRSETIGQLDELFTCVDNRWKIYKRKPGVISSRALEFHSPPLTLDVAPGLAPSSKRAGHDWDVQNEVNQLLLERFAPPAVIVDEAARIVRSRGRTSRFLELPTGEASLDVLRMARPGLLAPLRDALEEARHANVTVHKQGLEFGGAEGRLINLEITPIGQPDRRYFMILFEDATAREADARAVGQSALPLTDDLAKRTIEQLQHELGNTRVHMQSIIQDLEATNEELQAANEETLSSNEELQSTNEELDTAREELQSINEELGTVNAELEVRNAELAAANGDLGNLLASVQIPIVMVSSDLTIRRFTPAAERMLNLIKSDVGRPIGHIKPNIRCPELEQLLREVIDAVTVVEREVVDHEGSSHVLTLRPYKSVENRIEGAVLALFPVSATLKVAIETGEAIMSTVQDPILLLDENHRVQRANKAFCETFRVSIAETEGSSLFELGDGQWSIPALRRLLGEILPERKNFESFVVEHDFPHIGIKRMLLDGRRIESGRGGGGVILLIIREVS